MTSYIDLWKHGRALVILKIITDLGRPAQLKELVSLTAGDDETISRYCSLLAGMGLLTRISAHAGWLLTPQGAGFFTPNPALPTALPATQLSTAPVDNSVDNPARCAIDCPAPRPAPRPAKRSHPPQPVDHPQKALKSPPNPVNSPQSSPFLLTTTQTNSEPLSKQESQPTDFSAENLRFFEQIGILRNFRTDRLARQLDPALVRTEWQKLQDRHKAWPGLLVKILSSLPPPAHPRTCACPACLARKAERDRLQRQRYALWNT